MHEHSQSTDEATFVWPQLDRSTYLLNVLIYNLVVSLSPGTQVRNWNNLNARFRHSFRNRKPDWIAQRRLCVFHPVIDNPPRSVIDIFSFQCIRGTLYSNPDRYCVTRPRFLLVRNVASRYDPWPHFFLDLAVQPEFFRSRGEREREKESGKRKRTSERNCREQERITFERCRLFLLWRTDPEIRGNSYEKLLVRTCRLVDEERDSVLLIVQRNDRAKYSANRADFVTRSELNASSREIRVKTVACLYLYVRVGRYRDSRVRKSSGTRNSRTDGRWCVSKTRSCRFSFDSLSKSTGCSFTK